MGQDYTTFTEDRKTHRELGEVREEHLKYKPAVWATVWGKSIGKMIMVLKNMGLIFS